MEQNRALVILILLIIIFFQNGQEPDQSNEAIDEIAHERYSLELLRNSTFGHPGNLTGLFTDAPTPPELVREKWKGTRAKLLKTFAEPLLAKRGGSDGKQEELLRPWKSGATVYRNATGSVFGHWKKLRFPDLPTVGHPNTTYPKNFTALDAGTLTLDIEDTAEVAKEGGLGEVKMSLRIGDSAGGSVAALLLHGVHFSETGEMVAATTSERFAGIFALPHFMLYEENFNQSKAFLLPLIEKTVKKMEATRYLNAPWLRAGGTSLSEEPQCEYIVYTQLHPVDPWFEHSSGTQKDTKGLMREIEREMRFPTGASLPSPPPLEATTMIYSPNCGVVLVAKELEGQKAESLSSRAAHLGLGAAAVATLQIWLLIRQMTDSNTLSTISRVSFWTITMMGLVDGYLFFPFMIFAIFVRASFLPMAAAAFCYLMLSVVFGMRFLVSAYKVQRQSAPLVPAALPPPPTAAAARSDDLSLPRTAAPHTPTTTPLSAAATAVTDDEVNAEINSLHTRFYFTLIAILFFTFQALAWPPFYLNILIQVGFLVANSYWIPQIHRNIMRGCRKAFRWEFVIGTSICRLTSVVYIYLYPDNIFHSSPNPLAVCVIAGWVCLQILALAIQNIFGPRFLIPSHSLPQVYDYHRPLPAADEEAAQDLGMPTDGGRLRSFDCVVCMQTVDVPVAGAADVRDGLLSWRGYMITPCRHAFHSHCLEGWMRFRLQCPICRAPLPAV